MGKALYRWNCRLLRIFYAAIPFREGQIWAFESSENPQNARLGIYRIDSDARHGKIVYAVPMEVWAPKLTHSQGNYALFPMRVSALRRSVTKLFCKNGFLPNVETDYQYMKETFRNNQAIPFAASLKQIIDFHLELESLSRQQQTTIN